MSSLLQRAIDLRREIQNIVHEFHQLDAASANSPHLELSMQELRVVEYLGDAGSCMMRELAEYLLVAVNTMTTTVDNLERKNLVRRQRSETDRRIVQVELTEAGKQVYNSAVEEKLRLCRSLLSALNEDEQEIYMVLMRKIARAGKSKP